MWGVRRTYGGYRGLMRQDLVKSAALQLSRLICEETADNIYNAREFAMNLQHTYKPEANSLIKNQEEEETRLIGERMSREAGYDVTRGTGRKESKSGLMQTSVSATIRNNIETERHEKILRDTAHGIEAGYGKPTDTELTKSQYAAYCEFENGCEETGQKSFEYNKVKAVLNEIGFQGAELYETMTKVAKAPDVKKYLESGVISTREDLESVLTSASKRPSATKTRQR